jgi:hypothetical protein
VPCIAPGSFGHCKIENEAVYDANNTFLGNLTEASQLPNGTLDITKLTRRSTSHDEATKSKSIPVVTMTFAIPPPQTTNNLQSATTAASVADRDVKLVEDRAELTERAPLEEIILTSKCSPDGPTPCLNQ